MRDLRDLTYTYYLRSQKPRWAPPDTWRSSSILELGAGITPLATADHQGYYVAYDLAHPGKAASLPYVQGDARRLPFKDQSLDFFVSISLLEHVEDPSLILAELHRVCRKGGVISVPTLDSFNPLYDPVNWVRIRLALPVANFGIGGFGHRSVFFRKDWENLFQKAHFRVKETMAAPPQDLFETLEFSLLSGIFSTYDYPDLIRHLHSPKGSPSAMSALGKALLFAFSPVFKRVWKSLARLKWDVPGGISTFFTLERREAS